MKITEIRQGVRNENRVNVYVDGKYALSLDIAQVVDLGVKVGFEVSEEKLAELSRASEFGKLYQRALEWVLTRPRSEKELRDYLRQKIRKSSEDFANLQEEIIERLISRGYVDDTKFAEYYVENRFVKKGVSLKRLKMELMKKGVKKEVVDMVLASSERNDETEIMKIIARKRARYDDEKLIMYLCRQGFSFDLSRELVQTYETDSRNSE